MEYLAAYIVVIAVSLIATIACIPPFIQSYKEDNKPCMSFSVACFLLSLYITVRLIIAMIQYGGILA